MAKPNFKFQKRQDEKVLRKQEKEPSLAEDEADALPVAAEDEVPSE